LAKINDKKTNAMRQLDNDKIPYSVLTYDCDGENFDGRLVARQVGLPCSQVFKTLVARGNNGIVVCCIPVDKKLDLKSLAAACGMKKLEMLHVSEILGVTGYIRGGCSPIAMKKTYDTYIDDSACDLDTIAISAGVRGKQIVLAASDLISYTQAVTGAFSAPMD
jgi:Cys-tRNA(Pro)/Cys-tRNA(Cys) deacylase